ncbi:NADP-dependent 3-hydroxy acid dehydrogenase YdfG [Saccharopolyspora erythraea NRRL 2338]|uniref:Short-chain dehydrogenase/reductase SDR n=2 Tax=Saccharopolyspora erythraea TaxID=1836 RepID=A4FFK3_SACEN|nr:SDR family oxidoreductase [Saccharopolyspora erythraea]EQD82222.1 short-chain dehydrogenase [Saccharopolyspora erythraea D]PFG96550.1 NADP-dependent 3-hydroxy acid dehydrogenase YdfG [Saccharopolyspora erythraea NRRL 2338]CAM02828.1 short-chain dehydrogenase/reductase SDR [Saccharopolyspora erythraea NRRL 2338]
MTRRVVTTGDGLSLAVWEHGDPDRPTVVAVHGYPDDHSVWDGVVRVLAEHYHVVTYDVRGAGESDKPRERAAYRLDRLVGDLAAVLDAVSPDRPAHLLAHDWGSIQAWQAVTEEQLRARIASFTSISGPCLDHAGAWMRGQWRRPTPRNLRQLLTQLAFSGYIGFFQLPVLPELAWYSGAMSRLLSTVEKMDPVADGTPPRPRIADGVRGLELYRANMMPRLSAPRVRRTSVPVQVLAPTGDPFVSTPLQAAAARWVPEMRLRRLPGGHWLPRTRPELIARCAAELVENVESGAEPRSLRQARVGSGRFADRLVVITGAGSGIGRATALELAERGAEIVAADVDEKAAARTAELAALLGPGATPYQVDVSDGEAMQRFAEDVRTRLGVPDIVVNNAGIGMAGAFADTTTEDWERVIDVNLWGVIHGCRLFARQMTERGEGGRIVNIASAAAYLPSRTLPAYSTTKAAVLALSQCLRAELASAGIGITAVCPGLVNTGITSTTRFVGTGEEEQGRRRLAATALYRRRGFTPERAAAGIVRAIERDAAVAPITAEARAGLVLSRLTPGLLRAAARIEANPR